MARRLVLTAALLNVAVACGGGGEPLRELRLIAPAGVVDDTAGFERATGCRIDLRVYDDDEDVAIVARRRNADVVAVPAPPGAAAHAADELVQITLARGLEVTIPKPLAAAFDAAARPAGHRRLIWRIRADGDNDACARRWLAHVTS